MLKPFFMKYGWRYIPGAAFLLFCAWLTTRAPIILGSSIDAVSARDWPAFVHQIWLMLAVALGVFVTRDIWRYFIVLTSREMEIYLRDRLYDHFQLLPVRFYGTHRSGDLMAYAINDLNAVRMMSGMVVASVLNSLSTFGFSVASMAGSINPLLTLYALIPVPFAVAAVLIIGQQIQVRFRRVQELFSTLSGHVQENINGMRVLKAFAQEARQSESYGLESNEKRESNIRLYRMTALLNPVITVLFGISYMIGIIYGGSLVISGNISLGNYVSFNTFLTIIVMPIMMIGRISNSLQRGLASYKRLGALMNEEEVPVFERTSDGKEVGGDIEIRSLTFKYDDAPTSTLRNINLSIRQGGTLGIVGPTGSGKSTLIQLFMKLLPVPRGTISVGGRDVCDIPAVALRDMTGYVPQDGFLFNISLKENIDFFSGATMEEIEEAVRVAGLTGDIARMPEGYQTLCGERGNHLSGGQRQRASLARALVRDPKLLLLDDTLSAVDAHTEGEILGALSGELKDKTAIIIAHRLTAVKSADEIIYLEEGMIVERGTHESLLKLGGKYADMWEKQQREEAKQ